MPAGKLSHLRFVVLPNLPPKVGDVEHRPAPLSDRIADETLFPHFFRLLRLTTREDRSAVSCAVDETVCG